MANPNLSSRDKEIFRRAALDGEAPADVEEGMRFAVGTVGYSAPEQFSGLATGKAADVHAIGAMIYACYRGEMPRCWRRIYLAATASNPKSRYQTVQELRRAVSARHWRKMMAAGVASVLIAGIVFVGFHVFQKKLLVSDSQEESLAPLKETFSFMIDGPDTNKQYSIRCHVFYFIANQASGDDSEFCCPSNNELMLWLKDSIYEEYAYYDGLLDYESLREDFLSGDFKQNITEKFISYIDDKVLDMDQSTQLGIDIMRVVVEPEGAFREDLEKAKQEPE